MFFFMKLLNYNKYNISINKYKKKEVEINLSP